MNCCTPGFPVLHRLSEFAQTHVHWEKAMAPRSSTLAWKIPWTEEPGRLRSMGSLGVGHDWATSLSLFTFIHWRRKWKPTPVFLPGESQGWGSLVGCCLCGRTESDTTEASDLAAAAVLWKVMKGDFLGVQWLRLWARGRPGFNAWSEN